MGDGGACVQKIDGAFLPSETFLQISEFLEKI